MDVADSDRRDIPRPPLLPAEKYNAAPHRPRLRQVSSRYKSPTPSRPATPTAATAARSSSPIVSRTPRSPSLSTTPKRSISAYRRRPATPPSPSSSFARPSTPVKDSAVDVLTRRNGGRLPEGGLWPSTMRSLSVSFQSDSISIPVSVSKKEKPVSGALSDRTLRSSSNVSHRQQKEADPRKLTPERKRSPLRGKNVSDQSENSKPVDTSHSRLIDQHRWPSRIGGKVSSNANSSSLNQSLDLGPRILKLSTPAPGAGVPMLRRMPSADGLGNPVRKLVGDDVMSSGPHGLGRSSSVDDSSLHKLVSSRLLSSTTPKVRSLSRPSSPSSRTSSMFSPSVSRGVSPSRSSRPSTPPSRGVSPSRTRVPSTSCQSSSTTSVLSFIADFKGKKSAGYIEDAHQLRLLHNRYIQWKFTNARAEAVLYIQKEATERTLSDVWNTTLTLWDSVISKRIKFQQLNLEVKLKSVLNGQMDCLDDWASIERDHFAAFSGAMEDLEASTLRLPVTGGARTDIDSLKVAICSAVDVMQAMGSSICSLLSRVEGVNGLVSELATVAAREKAMLDECEALLASAAAMQVEEYSLTTQVIQMKQDSSSQFWEARHLVDHPD